MNNKLNLSEFAVQVAHSANTMTMLPVIEKELLHYEMLGALDKAGLLDGLVFQGGTCLRLCYGALRYSEDLDFAGGQSFDFESISRIKEVLEGALSERYSVESKVIEGAVRSDESGTRIKKWQVKVVTAPERPDIPMQRISLEVASVPAYTGRARSLLLNYDVLPDSYAGIILRAESLTEICADKLKAFLTANYVRYRDLWDMNWISHKTNIEPVELKRLFHQKLADYAQEDTAHQNLSRVDDISSILESSQFHDQMRRFIPVGIMERTIDRQIYLEEMSATLVDLYRAVL